MADWNYSFDEHLPDEKFVGRFGMKKSLIGRPMVVVFGQSADG